MVYSLIEVLSSTKLNFTVTEAKLYSFLLFSLFSSQGFIRMQENGNPRNWQRIGDDG